MIEESTFMRHWFYALFDRRRPGLCGHLPGSY
jgi:hypothetical protein